MKIRTIITSFLSCIMFFCAVGCKPNSDEMSGTKAVNPIRDSEAHFVEGTLHRVNVTSSNKTFCANGSTEYQLLLGDGELHREAADFIFRHVRAATGASLTYVEQDTPWSNNAKYIVLGDKDMFQEAGLSMPKDNLGQIGYYIKTVGNSVFIMSAIAEGYQLGAIAFLKQVIGYDMLAADCVVYEKDGATLPEMEIVEKPDFDVRTVSNIMSASGKYGMGYTKDRGIIAVDGVEFHNSFNYLPPKKYLSTENGKYWFSDVLTVANGIEYRQLCYTAHGNQEAYASMQEVIVERMLGLVLKHPDKSIITFTQEDIPYHCKCEYCLDIVEEYGTISAAIIMFCNDLSDKLNARLQELAHETGEEAREITVAFFAYHVSEAPPVQKNSNGEYTAINGIHCNSNVSVLIAPIYAKYNRSLYEDINAVYKDNMEGWTVVSDKIMTWLYQTNYHYYFYPLNTWDSQIENYRLCKSMGSMYMFNEGQYDQSVVTHFTKLKEYIDSKALIDVNVSHNELVDRFFQYYFLDAAEPMRQFFDELQAHMNYLETEYSGTLTGHIRDDIGQSRFWPQRKIEGWLELIDQAYAAIEKYKNTDVEKYEMLREHIMIESIFPKYVMCSLHSGAVSIDTLQKMRREFYTICGDLGITMLLEHVSISSLWEEWGIV